VILIILLIIIITLYKIEWNCKQFQMLDRIIHVFWAMLRSFLFSKRRAGKLITSKFSSVPNDCRCFSFGVPLGDTDLCFTLFLIRKEQVILKKSKKQTPKISLWKRQVFREWDTGQGPQLAVVFFVLCSVHFRQPPSMQHAKGRSTKNEEGFKQKKGKQSWDITPKERE